MLRFLIRTLTHIPAFLQAEDIWLLNNKFLSIKTPKTLGSSIDCSMKVSISTSHWVESFDIIIAWYLLGFPCRTFSLYHHDANVFHHCWSPLPPDQGLYVCSKIDGHLRILINECHVEHRTDHSGRYMYSIAWGHPLFISFQVLVTGFYNEWQNCPTLLVVTSKQVQKKEVHWFHRDFEC